ncbi:MAG: calcium/sodium antiporter [Saprospiraceae bacterium]|nr:calcium/sodium antiporter [Saprospiraceae bacterium]
MDTNMVLLNALIFVISLGVLVKASDWFVEGAEQIGLSIGISPFVIGVTIVAFGTSLPELATSVASVIYGNSEIVIGNVVGSNVTNILVVLGVTAIWGKVIHLGHNIMDIDMPLLIISALLLFYVITDLHVSSIEVFILLGAMLSFLIGSFGNNQQDTERVKSKFEWMALVKLIVGGVLVWLGADFTIRSIQVLSEAGGISPDAIAISAVAIGTSLPEIVVSITAARRGQTEMAVGNVLGSNIFNTYFVMGIPAIFGDLVIPEEFRSVYLPFMLGVTGIFAFICHSGRISRWEGLALVFFYILFLAEVARLGIGT